MLGADAGDFFNPRSLWNSSLAFPSTGEPTALSQCSPKAYKKRSWIIFPSQGVGLVSLPPALGFNLALPCWEFHIREAGRSWVWEITALG